MSVAGALSLYELRLELLWVPSKLLEVTNSLSVNHPSLFVFPCMLPQEDHPLCNSFARFRSWDRGLLELGLWISSHMNITVS